MKQGYFHGSFCFTPEGQRGGWRVPGGVAEGRSIVSRDFNEWRMLGFVPEVRLILARDFSPWKPLEKGCVPSGRLKRRPGGSNRASDPAVTLGGDRSQTPKASLWLRPAWPGLPFQASRRDAISFKCPTQGLKSLVKISRPSGTKPGTCHLSRCPSGATPKPTAPAPPNSTRHPAPDARHPKL